MVWNAGYYWENLEMSLLLCAFEEDFPSSGDISSLQDNSCTWLWVYSMGSWAWQRPGGVATSEWVKQVFVLPSCIQASNPELVIPTEVNRRDQADGLNTKCCVFYWNWRLFVFVWNGFFPVYCDVSPKPATQWLKPCSFSSETDNAKWQNNYIWKKFYCQILLPTKLFLEKKKTIFAVFDYPSVTTAEIHFNQWSHTRVKAELQWRVKERVNKYLWMHQQMHKCTKTSMCKLFFSAHYSAQPDLPRHNL